MSEQEEPFCNRCFRWGHRQEECRERRTGTVLFEVLKIWALVLCLPFALAAIYLLQMSLRGL